ncbi:MAG TPA: ABC transporter permease [Bryobacteraceae bacterium]|jgi:putative ABC transport system permease protein|nr:ABC transporter permease [Bryobacteraceae bacterium]
MLRDFRFAFRVLASRPAFTLVAALSLALGIGANSAIFGLIDGLWFRPLAVPKSNEIVRIFSVTDQDRQGRLSYPEYLDFKQQATQLREVVAIGGRGATLVQGNNHQLLNLNLVSSNFFTALGVKPLHGRLFTPQDEADTTRPFSVVLGNSCWHRYFGADPNIVGKQIRIQRINDVLVTVMGVLPASFRGIENGGDRDLWFSRQAWKVIGQPQELEARGNRWFFVMGRLVPGATEKSANTQIETIARRMADTFPAANKNRRAALISDFHFRVEQGGTNGLTLLAIVLLVVIISSVNVANLLLSRAGVRGKEMAMRLALGAVRWRLMQQLMAENILLGLLGLAGGIAVGAWLIQILPVLMVQPPGFYNAIDFQFDSRVLLFSLAVSLVTIVLFGLAPAWKSARPDLLPALKGDAAFGVSTRRRWPLRNWLVVSEVGIAMTLLVCAGVLVRSFANTRSSDLGFARKQLLLVWVSQDDVKPPLYREVVEHFEAMPGVHSVAAAVRAPLSLSSGGMFQYVTFPGRTEFTSAPPFEIKYNSVTRNFLNTMGTPVLRGRGFEERDETPGATSVLINETMARRFWPGQNPIGKTISVGSKTPRLHTVIGVVKNAPINQIDDTPEPYLYLAYWPNFEEEVTFLIETQGDAAALAQTARRVLKSVDSRLDPFTITTENELIRYSAQTYQVTAELVGTLGLLGLILTAVGLYGVVSYGVSQRTREIGIRMALGAGKNETLGLVVREVVLLGLIGMAAGLPLALYATRYFASLLFGVPAWDAPTFVGAAILLAAVLVVAGLVPARRATNIEPVAALRSS